MFLFHKRHFPVIVLLVVLVVLTFFLAMLYFTVTTLCDNSDNEFVCTVHNLLLKITFQ